METSKKDLQELLRQQVISQVESLASPVMTQNESFHWSGGVPVVATYSSISNLLLFEESKKKGKDDIIGWNNRRSISFL
jgi:hypothetical protein